MAEPGEEPELDVAAVSNDDSNAVAVDPEAAGNGGASSVR
tara:strand:+ start:1283 stop:1402 length:120 start_codon:yes stop_codon:yes gene_type:complete